MQLSDVQARVVGSLIEKELTTPQQYPLTLNALQLACNQSSNRDPVVAFDERSVEEALALLKAEGLVSFVYPSHGRSVNRYQQLLGARLGLTKRQLALVAVLLLRGPQTAAELRARTDRMCDFDDVAGVERELAQLGALDEAVVTRVARGPGQKEERWAQLLAPRPGGESHEQSLGRDRPGISLDSHAELAAQVAGLRAEVDELRAELEALRHDLGA